MGARIVFIGDDFTGASDSLANYARRGLRTRLITGAAEPGPGLDVLGIATDFRSLPPEQAISALQARWPMIAAEAPEVIHFKVCSTYDSAPHIGSIGAIANELRRLFRPDIVAVIGGQPSLGRYCCFGTLFALGPDGAVHRIDRHPVMARHPVTPMAEADLARHLAAQGLELPVRIDAPELGDTDTLAARLSEGPALLDTACAEDQPRIRAALDRTPGRKLIIGASSVAEIFGGVPTELPAHPLPPRDGGVLIFTGSRSSVTAAQVAAATRYTRLPLPPAHLSDPDAAQQFAEACDPQKNLLIHLDPEADYGRSPTNLADACAAFLQTVVARRPVRALGLAGGDTSSRIIARLGFNALDFHRDLGKGTCVCLAHHEDASFNGIPVMLKGGQMGRADLFDNFASYHQPHSGSWRDQKAES